MHRFLGFLIALTCLPLACGWAQNIPRIKARILSFDGKTLNVTSGTAGQSLTIGLMANTRLMYETKADLASIRPGDYLGATLEKSGSGWQAQEVHVLPKVLRGAGEGLYPLPSQPEERMATGQVLKNDGGLMTLSFRGSVGSDGPTCTGRAPSDGGCKGEVTFSVPAKAELIALVAGDKSILVAGKVAAISVVAGPDGHLVTPGLTIEDETGNEAAEIPAKPARK
jgi:hypothetical protein